MEKNYVIYNFGDEKIEWERTPVLRIDEFPWYTAGEKQVTKVKCAIRADVLNIKVQSIDKYIRQEASKNNEPVYHDSCFEWFVTPVNKKGEAYFNIEISCNGTIYMAYRDNTKDRVLASQAILDQIKITSSIQKASWELDICIPIKVLEMMMRGKADRDIWYGNFYRCGGSEDEQYACWQAIDAKKPNFHLPTQFGKMIICEYK
ncbi:MAG: hypothetical protein K0S71_28 [Clostridia bacterium]|jgi:hypothetical protein|nr:hypothetical protein [Clostridia bacterium]